MSAVSSLVFPTYCKGLPVLPCKSFLYDLLCFIKNLSVYYFEGGGKGARVKKKKKDCLKIMSEFKSDLKSFMTSQFACLYVAAPFEGLDITRSS